MSSSLGAFCSPASEMALAVLCCAARFSNSCDLCPSGSRLSLWTVSDYECQFQAMPAPIHHRGNNLTKGREFNHGFPPTLFTTSLPPRRERMSSRTSSRGAASGTGGIGVCFLELDTKKTPWIGSLSISARLTLSHAPTPTNMHMLCISSHH